VVLCRRLELFSQALVAIDGSKFKAVNNRVRNDTCAKVPRRLEQIAASVTRICGGTGQCGSSGHGPCHRNPQGTVRDKV